MVIRRIAPVRKCNRRLKPVLFRGMLKSQSVGFCLQVQTCRLEVALSFPLAGARHLLFPFPSARGRQNAIFRHLVLHDGDSFHSAKHDVVISNPHAVSRSGVHLTFGMGSASIAANVAMSPQSAVIFMSWLRIL